MPEDRFATFTDRHEANALFEYICKHTDQPQQPLPFLTFLAPGGGGKSSLIDLLVHRYKTTLPFARFDFSHTALPKTLLPVLIDICYQLRRSSGGQNTHLTFPRFYLQRFAKVLTL